MIENFLHYVWSHKKFDVLHLKTTQHQKLDIVAVGTPNPNSGPDFFNGQIRIDDQFWAGNIEIHVKSSDWFVHRHESDPAYDNVILHVVYEDDTSIFRKDNSVIPTLELKPYLHPSLLDRFHKLFRTKKSWINCEEDFKEVSEFTRSHWYERLFVERLEQKCQMIHGLMTDLNQDWEAILFKMLTKNFGLKVNGDAFFSLANAINFSVIRKLQHNPMQLEALLFGQAGLLDIETDIAYQQSLSSEYRYLKQKFQLKEEGMIRMQFFRLRPSNFPTIRLSQLSQLYSRQHQLFSKVMEIETLSEYYELLQVPTSPFWDNHYTFSKKVKSSKKRMTKAFVDLLLINTILPMKFSYARQQGQHMNQHILTILQDISSEKNTIVKGFERIHKASKSAFESQALIQLKTQYCDKNKCLKCAIGNALLSNKF
ncbi:DUF2851 family protein [Psychroserpens sp. BH13MA-6]